MNWIDEEFEDLDDPISYAVDPSGVYDWIEKAGDKLEDGTKKYIGRVDVGAYQGVEIREVLISGMGGSAIAGDLAYSVVMHRLPVPCRVVRGYIQPGSLGKGTLHIVVSYSGNTEEAVWAYTQGHNRGAAVLAVCSGGALRDLAERHERLCVGLPDDYPAPRLALGHLLPAVLGVLVAFFPELGFVGESLEDAVTYLRRGAKRYARDLPYDKNAAKQLAYEIHGVFPVIVGSSLTWPAALRFQTQLNENAKWPAFATTIPEMNHNEIVAYTQPGPATGRIGLIVLADKEDHPRVQFRQDFTLDMVEKRVKWTTQLRGEGKTHLGRAMSLMQTADFVSYFLACARGLNPLTIDAIGTLKERMGKLQ